jgi:putative ABC transport system permease protein
MSGFRRAVLKLLPREFRDRHGQDLLDIYDDLYWTPGRFQRTRFVTRVFWDAALTGIAARLRTPGPLSPPLSEGRWSSMRSLGQDVRFAGREIAKAPAFSAVVFLILTVGIGVNVAMFGTMSTVLIRPLPFVDPDRLVMARATFDGQLNPWASAPDYFDYRDSSDAFESLAAILPFPQGSTITGGEMPERASGMAVSVDLFTTLGVNPQAGRHFRADEGLEGAPDVVLISHGYWQRSFAGSPEVVGQTLVIDGNPSSVVGVMPAGFEFLGEANYWRPMRPDRDAAAARDRHNWLLVGRLQPGLTIEQAQSRVDVISTQLQTAYPETNERKALLLTDLHEVVVEDYRARLFVLMAAVGLVLLIACGNVTGMLVARAPARRLELSVRAALGASRSRLVRQLLVESSLLAVTAGVAGIALAVWLQQIFLNVLQMEVPGIERAGFSTPALFLAVALALASGILAGIYPALSSTRANLAQELKTGARTILGGGTWFRSGLVVAQVAVSVVLLIGSGLLIRSFANVWNVNPGFDSAKTLTAEIELPFAQYSEPHERIRFYADLLEGANAIPGVVSAGLISHLPIREPRNMFHAYLAGNPDRDWSVFLRATLPGYFETMRIPLRSGRGFGPADVADATPVAIISETLAETLFPGQNPLGRQVVLDYFGEPASTEVVGVVGDVRIGGLSSEASRVMYLPYGQTPYLAMRIALRTDGDPSSLAGALRRTVRELDADIPLAGLTTMQEVVAESVFERKAIAASLTLYAFLPLVMAAVGLYSVLAYYVTQRFHEIGVRMALGADTRSVGRLILGRGVGLVLTGIVIGGGAALGVTRLIQQMLFGVGPADLATFAGVGLFVLLVAIVACLIPVWRAVRVDPSVALRAM